MRRWARLPISAFQTKCTCRAWLLWRSQGRGRRILAVIVRDEGFSDVDRITQCKNSLNFGHVEDQVNPARPGKSLERFSNVVVKRRKHFLHSLVECGFGVFSFALRILLHLVDLV